MAVVDEKTESAAPARRSPWWLAPARWWQELLIIGVGFAAYTFIQHQINVSPAPAMRNARGILHLEQYLGIAAEEPLNHWLAAHASLATLANDYYLLMHAVFTPLVILWVFLRHRAAFPYARFLLAVPTLIGFTLFYLTPVAPPRLLPGMVDTLEDFASLGNLSKEAMSHTAAEYAAFPSLHVAWALWCGVMLWWLIPRWYARIPAVLYPLCTITVVLVTGNHFVIDVVGGATVFAVGAGLLRLLLRPAASTVRAGEPATEQT
jgi:membrane-associated phospholipid phosphatase